MSQETLTRIGCYMLAIPVFALCFIAFVAAFDTGSFKDTVAAYAGAYLTAQLVTTGLVYDRW